MVYDFSHSSGGSFKVSDFRKIMQFIHEYNKTKERIGSTNDAEILAAMTGYDVMTASQTLNAIKMQFRGIPTKDQETEFMDKYRDYMMTKYNAQKEKVAQARRSLMEQEKFEGPDGARYTSSKLKEKGKLAQKDVRKSRIKRVLSIIAGVAIGGFVSGIGLSVLLPILGTAGAPAPLMATITSAVSLLTPAVGGVLGNHIYNGNGRKATQKRNKALVSFFKEMEEVIKQDEQTLQTEEAALKDLEKDFELIADSSTGLVSSEGFLELYNDYAVASDSYTQPANESIAAIESEDELVDEDEPVLERRANIDEPVAYDEESYTAEDSANINQIGTIHNFEFADDEESGESRTFEFAGAENTEDDYAVEFVDEQNAGVGDSNLVDTDITTQISEAEERVRAEEAEKYDRWLTSVKAATEAAIEAEKAKTAAAIEAKDKAEKALANQKEAQNLEKTNIAQGLATALAAVQAKKSAEVEAITEEQKNKLINALKSSYTTSINVCSAVGRYMLVDRRNATFEKIRDCSTVGEAKEIVDSARAEMHEIKANYKKYALNKVSATATNKSVHYLVELDANKKGPKADETTLPDDFISSLEGKTLFVSFANTYMNQNRDYLDKYTKAKYPTLTKAQRKLAASALYDQLDQIANSGLDFAEVENLAKQFQTELGLQVDELKMKTITRKAIKPEVVKEGTSVADDQNKAKQNAQPVLDSSVQEVVNTQMGKADEPKKSTTKKTANTRLGGQVVNLNLGDDAEDTGEENYITVIEKRKAKKAMLHKLTAVEDSEIAENTDAEVKTPTNTTEELDATSADAVATMMINTCGTDQNKIMTELLNSGKYTNAQIQLIVTQVSIKIEQNNGDESSL